jgi:hypothetical protein
MHVKILRGVLACSGVVYYYITKSPKHLDDSNATRRTTMSTSTSTKLAALALALMVNSVIMGGMAYLFNAQLQAPNATISLADATEQTTHGVG